jgi:hypothetical protein
MLTNPIKGMSYETAGHWLAAGAAVVASRKFLMAGGYKLLGKGAELIGSRLAADQWNKTADETYKLAKKDAFRDVTAVAGVLAVAGALDYVDETIKAELQANKSLWDQVTESKLTMVGSAAIAYALVFNTVCVYKVGFRECFGAHMAVLCR